MNQEINTPYIMQKKDYLAFFVMILGMFMAILDIQIVSSSLSEIQAGLSAGPDDISWVQTAYLIAEIIMIPLSGFLNRLISTRVLFTASALGFTVSSLLCSNATSIEQMMLYRAIQGFIGGAMIPTVFVTAYSIFSKEKRAIVTPIIGLVVTLAPTIGPTVGGYLSDQLSWHWLFLINVPIGMFVTIVAGTTIDFDKGDLSLINKVDWIGVFAMAVFLGSLEYVLEEGPKNNWLESDKVYYLFIAMSIGAIIFFYRALTQEEPIVNLYAFNNLNFTLGTFFSFCLGIGLYGLTYMYPLYLSRVQNYTSYDIGTTMFVSGLSMFAGAPIAAILSKKMDQLKVMSIGFFGFSVCTLLSHQITSDWGFDQLFLPQIFRGISMMLCIVPMNDVALGTLSPIALKNASSLYNLTRNLGGAIGLGIINTILINRTKFHYQRLSETLNYNNTSFMQTIHNLGQLYSAQHLQGQAIAVGQVSGLVQSQATVMSIADCFYLITILFLILSVMVLFVKKPNKNVESAH